MKRIRPKIKDAVTIDEKILALVSAHVCNILMEEGILDDPEANKDLAFMVQDQADAFMDFVSECIDPETVTTTAIPSGQAEKPQESKEEPRRWEINCFTTSGSIN